VIRAHIQEIPENGSDTAHLNILHFRSMIFQNFFVHKWDAVWKPCEAPNDYKSHLVIKEKLLFLDKFVVPFGAQEAQINQIGPGLVYLDFTTIFGRIVVFETVTPLGPLLQTAQHTIFADRSVPRWFAKLLFTMLINQFERDVPIWANKTYNHAPMLVKEDGNIGQFRRWFSKFYSKNSPTLESLQKASLDW